MIIRGNTVWDSTFGGIIVEASSENVAVEGNTVFESNDYGIHIGNPYGSSTSSNITVRDNIVYDNSPSGICLLEADTCTIEGNLVFGNVLNGIVVESGSHQIIDNNVTEQGTGILVSGGNCTLTENVVTRTEYAIAICTEHNTLNGNYLAHNAKNGLRFYFSSYTGSAGSNNDIVGNVIANNSRWGVEFAVGTSNNYLMNNDFLMNGVSGQAVDDGSSNIISENFWDDWMRPDSNHDNYVDNPYTINGTAGNEDVYPHTSPHNPLPDWYILPTPKLTTIPAPTPPPHNQPGPIPLIELVLIVGGAGVLDAVVMVMVAKQE
jgi:parallel beta-helix repeat protein